MGSWGKDWIAKRNGDAGWSSTIINWLSGRVPPDPSATGRQRAAFHGEAFIRSCHRAAGLCDCSCLRGSCISSRQLAWVALGRNPPSSGLISDTRVDLAAGAATTSVPSMKTTNRRSWRVMTGPSGSHVVSALATSRLNPRGGPLSASNQGTLRCDPVRSDALPDCGHDVVTLASARWERG